MKNLIKCICMALAVTIMIPVISVLTACGPVEVQVSSLEQLTEALSGTANIVKLTEDIQIDRTLQVNRKLTLDLNGKTLSCSTDIWCKADKNDWSLISVRKNGDLLIKGNGKIEAKQDDSYALDVMDGGVLTIESGEFVGNITAVYCYEGEVFIKGGKYSILQLNNNGVESAYGLTINIYNQNGTNGTAKVSLTGGTYENFNPSDKSDNADKLVADGYISQLVEGSKSTYQVVAE